MNSNDHFFSLMMTSFATIFSKVTTPMFSLTPLYNSPANHNHPLKTDICAVLLQDQHIATTLIIEGRVSVGFKMSHETRVEMFVQLQFGKPKFHPNDEMKFPLKYMAINGE